MRDEAPAYKDQQTYPIYMKVLYCSLPQKETSNLRSEYIRVHSISSYPALKMSDEYRCKLVADRKILQHNSIYSCAVYSTRKTVLFFCFTVIETTTFAITSTVSTVLQDNNF